MKRMLYDTGRKTLAFMLTVVMLFSAWVFVEPDFLPKAEAATAGNYRCWIKYQVTNKADESGHINSAYFKVGYKSNNGTGTQTGNGSGKEYNMKSDCCSQNTYTRYVDCPGWPTGVYMYIDGSSPWDEITYKLTEARVSNTSVSSYNSATVVWTGSMENSCSGLSDEGTRDWNGGNAGWPAAKNVSVSASTTSVKCSGSTTFSVSAVTDQYGVSWYQDPSLSWSLPSGATRSSYTVTFPESGSSGTAKLTATCGNASASASCTFSPHNWGSWSSINDTQHKRTCSYNSSHTQTASHSGGTATCTAAKKCSTCGSNYGTALGHSWGAWTKISDTQHKRTCSRDSTHTETASHTGGTATCTAAKVCSTCNSSYGSALGHNWGAWTKISETQHKRTCSRDGTHTETAAHSGGTATCTAAKVCSTCNTAYGNPLGHDFTSQTATDTYLKTPANCVDKAVYYYKCSRCSVKGTNTYEYGSVNASNHKATEDRVAVAPTCTEVGYNAGVYCTACNKWVSGHAQVAALGHDWGEWITDTAATCSAAGTKHRICGRCSARDNGTIDIIPTAHSWNAPSFTWSLDGTSCTAKRVCAHDSSHVETERATVENGQVTSVVKTPSTCIALGWTTYTASFTNSAFSQQSTDREDIDMLPHSYTGAVRNNEDGTHQKLCVNGCNQYGPVENCTYGEVSYDWADNGKTCTASHQCSVCDYIESETATIANHKITGTVKTDPTCSEMGTTTYTAVFTVTAFGTVTKDVVDIATVETAHDWDLPTYEFADDGHSCTATRVCKYDAEHVETETVTLGNGISGELAEDSTCLEPGTTKYTASFENEAFEDQVKYVKDINPKAHSYTDTNDVKNNGDGTHSFKCIYGCVQYGAMIDGEPVVFADGGFVSCDDSYGEVTFTFTADGTSCTAQRTCAVCGYVQSETVTAAKTQKIAPTCSEMGTSTYTATFTNPAFMAEDQSADRVTDRVDIPIVPTAHDWAAPTYVFADDGKTCTATRICNHNNEHIETETATVENGKIASVEKTASTCLVMGWTTYTATFDNTAFAVQTKDVQDIPMKGHVYSGPVRDNEDGTHSFQCINGCEQYGATVSCENTYGEISYVWAEDGSTCTGSRECQTCGHIQSEAAVVTSEEVLAPTCMTKGKTTYTATFDAEGPFSTQTLTLEDIAIVPTAHNYGAAEITFSEDGKTCTACRICEYNAEHVDSETVTAAAVVKTPATCVEMGWTTYTATFENPAFMLAEQSAARVTERKDIAIDPLNHASELIQTPAKAATCEEDGNNDYWYCSSCEKYFSDDAGTTVTTVAQQTLPALGHDWRFVSFEWAEDNKSAKVNLVCDHDADHTKQIAAAMSTEVHVVTCEEDGYTIYTATYESAVEETKTDSRTVIDQSMLGHDYGTPTFTWSDDGQSCTAERICRRDASHVETETVTFGNGITGVITTPSTCVTKGVTTYTATFESEAFMQEAQADERVTTCVDVEIDPTNHATELIATEAVAPLCLREGNSAYWYCESCDLYFSDAEGKLGTAIDSWILPPTGHQLEWKEETPPTCMEEGLSAYQECTVCGFINGQNEIPIVDHDFYHVPISSGYVYDRSMQWNVYTCKFGCGVSYMKFSAYVRNDQGQPLSGATVRLTGGEIDEEVVSDENGIATFYTHAIDGVYELKVHYDGADGTGEAEGKFTLYDGKGSGGFGSITTTGPIEEPATDPQTEEPTTNNNTGNNGNTGNTGNNGNTDNNSGNTPANNNGNTDNGGNSGNNNAGGCKYCGGTHTGPFGWFIQLIHNILAAFKR